MPQAKDEAGNVWELDAQGNPIRLVSQAGGMPVDPAYESRGQKARADAQGAGATASVNAATVPAQIAKAGADAVSAQRGASTAGLPEGFMWNQDGSRAVPIPGYTRQGLSPEVRSEAITGYTDADALDALAEKLQKRYEADFEGRGLRSLDEYSWFGLNQRAANEGFNTTANRGRGLVKRGLGFTGGEGNTIGENVINYGPYLPQSGDRDSTIETKIQALRELAMESRKRSVALLGGIPDANGNVTPLPPGVTLESALKANQIIAGSDVAGTAGFGATKQAVPIPEAMQQENLAWMAQNLGNLDPKAYADFRTELDRRYNYQGDWQTYYDWAAATREGLAKGSTTVNPTIPAPEQEMDGTDIFRNKVVNNEVGAAIVGAADMGGFGGVSALAGDKVSALGDEHPVGTTIGQVLGALGGTSALKKVGTGVVKSALPKRAATRVLRGGGGKGQFARDLLTDATYGGIYGGVTEGDPLTGAAWGAGASTIGQLGGKALGAGIGGVSRSKPAQALKDSKVVATIGSSLGKIPKMIEDAATSIPGVGDMIIARRGEAFNDLNRAVFREGGQEIGFVPSAIGEEGADQLLGAAGDYLEQTTAGVDVPLDQEFGVGLAAARQLADRLPTNVRPDFDLLMQNELGDIATSGRLTGQSYQQAMRALKQARRAPPSSTFEQQWRDAVTGAMETLEQQMRRGGGEKVVQGLDAGNAVYRKGKTIKDAVYRARSGSRSGELQVFTPSQLNDAAYQTARKYPGARPFAELADNAQRVLPSSVPDSGTPRRMAQMGLSTALLGGGAGGTAYATGEYGDTAKGALTLGTLLALGGTKQGQKRLGQLLFERPEALRTVGDIIKKNTALGGTALLPFAFPE